MMNKPVDNEKLRKFRASLDETLDLIEHVYLKDQDYFAGDNMTLADLLGICELMQPFAASFDVTEGRPKLKAWMERVKMRLQPHFDEAHNLVYRLAQAQKQSSGAKI